MIRSPGMKARSDNGGERVEFRDIVLSLIPSHAKRGKDQEAADNIFQLY